jgi:hypothetical protein
MRRRSAKRRLLLALIVLGVLVLALAGMVIRPLGRTWALLTSSTVAPARRWRTEV